MLSDEQIAQLNAAGFAHPSQMTREDARRTAAEACDRFSRAFAKAGRKDWSEHYAQNAAKLRK